MRAMGVMSVLSRMGLVARCKNCGGRLQNLHRVGVEGYLCLYQCVQCNEVCTSEGSSYSTCLPPDKQFAEDKEGDLRAIEGLVGYRSYGLTPEGLLIGAWGGIQEQRLSPPAQCSKGPEHPIPNRACTCGYYALTLPPDVPVVAQVEARGRTRLAMQGWRSECVELQAIWLSDDRLPDSLAHSLWTRYGVPVRRRDPK